MVRYALKEENYVHACASLRHLYRISLIVTDYLEHKWSLFDLGVEFSNPEYGQYPALFTRAFLPDSYHFGFDWILINVDSIHTPRWWKTYLPDTVKMLQRYRWYSRHCSVGYGHNEEIVYLAVVPKEPYVRAGAPDIHETVY